MKRKLSIVLAISMLLVACGSPSNSGSRMPTRGEVMRETTERYERCLEEDKWSRRQCREHYERQMEPLLP